MERLFGKLKMNWVAVILFAIAAGVYTGCVMSTGILKGTSFQDIGVTYEWWVVFAVIVVVNCEKCLDAMFKCFVLFLISQPLVYAVEALFGALTLGMGWYYYRTVWLPMTFLTLPGGLIASFCKKQNLLGGIVLGLGNTVQTVLGVMYAVMAAVSFPHHLLSSLFCFASVFVMSFCIQKRTGCRLISLLLPIVLTALLIALAKASGHYLVSGVF